VLVLQAGQVGGGTARSMDARCRTHASLARAALCIVLFSCAAAPKPVDHQHFPRSISDGGGTVYLVGSIHLAGEGRVVDRLRREGCRIEQL
jgi:uncharacterized protein YbaP (TraB family)